MSGVLTRFSGTSGVIIVMMQFILAVVVAVSFAFNYKFYETVIERKTPENGGLTPENMRTAYITFTVVSIGAIAMSIISVLFGAFACK